MAYGDIWTQVPEDLGVFAVGDRVPWCEDCYGVVVAKVGGNLAIRTDDGIDRMMSEASALDVEAALQRHGIEWS
jgi:hypothetical protein